MIRSFFSVVLLSSVLLPAAARAGKVEAVSVPATPSSSPTAEGFLPTTRSAVSNDGRWIAFTSNATDVVPEQVDQLREGGFPTVDVFLRDRATGTTFLVSHTAAGANVAATGDYPLISDDGSVVAFYSEKGALIPGQPSPVGDWNIYLYERATGNLQRATPIDTYVYWGYHFDLSADGRWLVYSSAPSGNSVWATHVYLFDRLTGQRTLVDRSAVSPGQPSDGYAWGPKISADGRYIAFHSSSTDILADQGGLGTFLYDRVEDTMIRVTSSQTEELRLSADGRWIAFLSQESDLISGLIDTNSFAHDIFLWDRVTGGLTLVSHLPGSPLTTPSVASGWAPKPGWPEYVSESVISADGRWIAFLSTADDYAGENDDTPDLFLFDRTTGVVTRVSNSIDHWVPMYGYALSEDGSRVVYISSSAKEVPGQEDGLASPDAFVFDRAAGTRELASRSLSSATQGTYNTSPYPHLSADGRVAVFGSRANLVDDDTLFEGKVFAYVIPDPGQDFYTVTPCRILDTRQAGPVLFSEIPRRVTAAGSCGIPATARALAVNVTVLQPSGPGRLVAQPGDVSSETSSINFAAGETRANHASVGLAFDGTGTLSLTPRISGGGTVHAILDVFGYYE